MNRVPASPFVGDQLFAPEPPSAAQARAGQAAAQSPFIDALLPGWADEAQRDNAIAAGAAELDAPEREAPAIEQFAPQPAPSQMPAIKATPAFRIVVPSAQRLGKPLVNARWSVHQDGATFQGTLDANGWTGPLANAAGSFDRAKPFRLHVEGHVCCIVSGAALLVRQPEVEYGGQFVDWGLADDPDRAKRDAFWREYDQARTLRAPLDVFSFIQHDHVMRRPVKLLSGQLRAEFEARPLAIRLGPVLRYVGTHRALVWLELETPGIARVTYGKASRQSEIPQRGDQPGTRSERYASTVRVGGRHFALVWLDALEADTAYQYRIDLAPLPAVGALPFAPGDFGAATIPTAQPAGTAAGAAHATQIGLQWFFFRTASLRTDALRFAHGSCRKWPGDHDPKNRVPGPDMLEAFASHLLAQPKWADWPQFFLHSGDQIYADDIGVAMGRSMLGQRFASVLPGPAPTAADDIAFGAWAGRFGQRYSVRGSGAPKASPDDVDPKYLRSFFDYRGRDRSLVDGVIDTALDTRRLADIARKAADPKRPLRYRLRVGNDLLWRVPVRERDIPTVDKTRGLRTREAFAIKHRNRAYQLEYPSAGSTEGLHAADFAEYAALYEQAWSQPETKRLLAHLASFMIFDDHEVTDDWNADPLWLKVVHTDTDPLRCWPATLTDALCAYWVYQGWGNLAPEQWPSDPRVQLLERARREGRDALPALRRLVLGRSVQRTAPRANPAGKLDWHFRLPVAGIPFLAVDLRTDRDVNGQGGMSPARLRWLEDALAKTRSPVAFVVLPVPFLLPDPMLFPFRNPRFTAQLAGARSVDAFRHGSDLEHPAGNPVWDQIKGLLDRLQKSSTPLKTLVLVSGDIHFSCNLDGQLPDSRKAPRLLQLVSSGILQTVSDEKRGQLDGAYRGWLNAVSRAQGVDDHRGLRITLGGLQAPLGNKRNFLFDTSMAVVDLKIVAHGAQRTKVPLIVQTHLASGGKGALVAYTFRHMTQSSGGALMSLNDPGFAHPTSPSDYPATSGGIGIAKEFGNDDEAFDSNTAQGNTDPLLLEDPDDELEDETGDDSVSQPDAPPQLDPGEAFDIEDAETFATEESWNDGATGFPGID